MLAGMEGAGRRSGVVRDPGGLGHRNHVCWPYQHHGQFRDAAIQYVSDGLLLGERVVCVVDDDDVDALVGLGHVVGHGSPTAHDPALQFMSLSEAEGQMSPGRPEDRLAFYDAAVRQALADGYSGLRVLAEVTGLLVDPDRRPDQVSWEHLADEYMASNDGLSAMCAYRTDLLGSDAVADVACVHPVVREDEASNGFRLFFESDRLALAGTVDCFNADRLTRTLERSHVQRDQLTLDLGLLDFIDVQGVLVIANWGRRLAERAGSLRLVGVPGSMERVWDILELPQLDELTLQART
jgi:ABC-type transporter Mla MlaB component